MAQATKICLQLLQWAIDLENMVQAGQGPSTDALRLREKLSHKTDEVRPPGVEAGGVRGEGCCEPSFGIMIAPAVHPCHASTTVNGDP